MIVLDENIWNPRIEAAFRVWYRGQVVSINSLRPITLIKDDSIPQLLHKANNPTFITINATDFWRCVPAHLGYCIVTFPFPKERLDELPELSRQLFRLREFASKGTRMGKIVQVTRAQIMYTGNGHNLTFLSPCQTSPCHLVRYIMALTANCTTLSGSDSLLTRPYPYPDWPGR